MEKLGKNRLYKDWDVEQLKDIYISLYIKAGTEQLTLDEQITFLDIYSDLSKEYEIYDFEELYNLFIGKFKVRSSRENSLFDKVFDFVTKK